jgi:ubiquinone/menaquinone biosynthesis C-methylase UbiE
MKASYFQPLLGFVIPTVLIGYGIVIPRSCIAGVNQLSDSRRRSQALALPTGLGFAWSSEIARRPMAKSELIARQSRRPSGWLGEIVARVMAIETTQENRIALEQLAAREGEAVLEVGCGHGRTLGRLAKTGCAFSAGVDASDVMVRLARRRLDSWIRSGRAEVSRATSSALPYSDDRFDAAFAVHVLYFWTDPVRELREIRRVLRPGGRVLLGCRPRDPQALEALPTSVYVLRSIEEAEGLLAQAGFAAVRSVEVAAARRRFVCSAAIRPCVAGTRSEVQPSNGR